MADYTLNVTGDELQQLITKLKNGEFTGKDGIDGVNGITPHIGENGNWYIGNVDTGVKVSGDISSENVVTVINNYLEQNPVVVEDSTYQESGEVVSIHHAKNDSKLEILTVYGKTIASNNLYTGGFTSPITYKSIGDGGSITVSVDQTNTDIALQEPLRTVKRANFYGYGQDVLTKQDGKYGILKGVGYMLINSSIAPAKLTVQSTYVRAEYRVENAYTDQAKEKLGIVSVTNMDITSNPDSEGVYLGINNVFNTSIPTLSIRINAERLESVDAEGYNTYLNNNPVEVMYKIAEPYFTEITEQAKFNNISVKNGSTVSVTDANNLNAEISVCYNTDPDIYSKDIIDVSEYINTKKSTNLFDIKKASISGNGTELNIYIYGIKQGDTYVVSNNNVPYQAKSIREAGGSTTNSNSDVYSYTVQYSDSTYLIVTFHTNNLTLEHFKYLQIEKEKRTQFMQFEVSKKMLQHDFVEKSYSNKKIYWLGDSITANRDANYITYFNRVSDNYDYINFAVYGATWREPASNFELDGNPTNVLNNTITNQVQKILNGDYTEPDYIFIAAGTNDKYFEHFADEFDLITDIEQAFSTNVFNTATAIELESVDRKTFAGAIRWSVEKLQEKYQNTTIIIVTPIQRGYNPIDTNRGYQFTWATNKYMQAVAQRLSIYCIDGGKCGIYSNTAVNKGLLNATDMIHPTDAGAKVLGEYIAREYIAMFNK